MVNQKAKQKLPENSRDQLFTRSFGSGSFKFDAAVAGVFDDMIARSVPMYASVQMLAASIASKVCKADDFILDLGCSTGTSFIAIEENNPGNNFRFIGVDNSESMLARCAQKMRAYGLTERCQLIESDLKDCLIPPARLILLNYTLQFIAPVERLSFLKRLKSALLPEGILLVSEKIAHESSQLGSLLTDLHHDFKVAQGYSRLEVANKRDSLENVLIPFTLQQNLEMLKEAGFTEVEQASLALNFETFLAR